MFVNTFMNKKSRIFFCLRPAIILFDLIALLRKNSINKTFEFVLFNKFYPYESATAAFS